MHAVVLSLILASLGVDSLASDRIIPGVTAYLQECLALIAIVIVIVSGVRTRFANVGTAYWIAFASIAVVLACGALVNSVDTGPIFAGLRNYLRAIPLFFLPAVCALSVRQLRQQFWLIFAFALVQVPLAIYQRVARWSEGHISGDFVVGTLRSSAVLSVFLICVACVLAGLYMRKRLPLRWFIPLLLIVLIPTTVNETKATIFLLPLGLLATFIVASASNRRLRNGLIAVTALSLFGSIFVPVYDYYVKPRWGYGIVEFFTMQGRLEDYLARQPGGVGARSAGKVEGIVVPLKAIAREPVQLTFGYGIGNASESALGAQFTGEYFHRFEPYRLSTASVLILETGALGSALVLCLMFMIFRDAKFLALRASGLPGGLAAGWVGVAVVVTLSMFYTELMAFGSISFLFWYFSGLVAAERMRLERASASRVSSTEVYQPAADVRGSVA